MHYRRDGTDERLTAREIEVLRLVCPGSRTARSRPRWSSASTPVARHPQNIRKGRLENCGGVPEHRLSGRTTDFNYPGT
jgi:hypothetical protein